MTTEQLKKAFNNAEQKIINISDRKPLTTSTKAYGRFLNEEITKILGECSDGAGVYVEREIPRLYKQNTKRTADKLTEEHKEKDKPVPLWVLFTARDEKAIYNSQANTGTYLSSAIQNARTYTEDVIYEAESVTRAAGGAYEQQTEAMQQFVSERFSNGIQAAQYLRNGKAVSMNFSAYAELILTSAQNEIENISSLNFATNNGYDLVQMTQHFNSCAICMPYQGRVYSVSGKNPDYPYLYDTPWSEMFQNFHPNCRHLLNPWVEYLQTPNELGIMKEYSNRSFEIGGQGWTEEQTQRALDGLEAYRARQQRNRQVYIDRRQFERYKQRLNDKAPRSFSAFRRIKTANGARWEELQREFAQEGLYRRTKNTGAFEHLEIPMQKRYVTNVAKKYGIKINDLNIKIQRSEELLRFSVAGEAAPQEIGRIDLFPNAFANEEQLVRTLIHERSHVLQFKKYGSEYVQNNVLHFEDISKKFEEMWYNIAKGR